MADNVQQVVTLPRSLATKAKAASPSSRFESGQTIARDDQLSLVDTQTVQNLRSSNRVTQALRLVSRIDGTVSTAVYNMVQVANSGLRLKAFDSNTHTFSYEGSQLATSILQSMSTLSDYSKGYADKRPVESVVESGLREVMITGAIAGELVMSKLRLPDRFVLVPYEDIRFDVRGDGTKFPKQTNTGGDDIPLNIPNFWVQESHLESNTAYARSMLESALPMNFHYLEFIQDMRRVLRKAGHPRMTVLLDLEKVNAAAPEKVRNDPALLQAHQAEVSASVKQVIADMEPEDALVAYDVISEIKYLENKGEKADYTELMYALAGMLATSLKTHPSILGLRLDGSQNLANTESLVYLKVARAIQEPVKWFMSRAMTLASRLLGAEVYIRAEFDPINLRPYDELEAFHTMREQRIYKRLSLGLISSEEAAWELGIPALPAGFVELSGTRFEDGGGNGRADEASPNSDPMGRSLQSDQPKKAGGKSQ